MTAAEWLARAHAVTDAATPGPWADGAVELDLPGFMMSPRTCAGCGGDWPLDPADAAFIAASRTMLPAAVAAIEAVLALHIYDWNPRGLCMSCDVPGPCATVRAITAHLDPS